MRLARRSGSQNFQRISQAGTRAACRTLGSLLRRHGFLCRSRSCAGRASCIQLGRADNRIRMLAMRQELSAGTSLVSAAPSNPKILDLAARLER